MTKPEDIILSVSIDGSTLGNLVAQIASLIAPKLTQLIPPSDTPDTSDTYDPPLNITGKKKGKGSGTPGASAPAAVEPDADAPALNLELSPKEVLAAQVSETLKTLTNALGDGGIPVAEVLEYCRVNFLAPFGAARFGDLSGDQLRQVYPKLLLLTPLDFKKPLEPEAKAPDQWTGLI